MSPRSLPPPAPGRGPAGRSRWPGRGRVVVANPSVPQTCPFRTARFDPARSRSRTTRAATRATASASGWMRTSISRPPPPSARPGAARLRRARPRAPTRGAARSGRAARDPRRGSSCAPRRSRSARMPSRSGAPRAVSPPPITTCSAPDAMASISTARPTPRQRDSTAVTRQLGHLGRRRRRGPGRADPRPARAGRSPSRTRGSRGSQPVHTGTIRRRRRAGGRSRPRRPPTPRTTTPSTTTADARPVPRLRKARVRTSGPTVSRWAPRAAALTSLSTRTGRSQRPPELPGEVELLDVEVDGMTHPARSPGRRARACRPRRKRSTRDHPPPSAASRARRAATSTTSRPPRPEAAEAVATGVTSVPTPAPATPTAGVREDDDRGLRPADVDAEPHRAPTPSSRPRRRPGGERPTVGGDVGPTAGPAALDDDRPVTGRPQPSGARPGRVSELETAPGHGDPRSGRDVLLRDREPRGRRAPGDLTHRQVGGRPDLDDPGRAVRRDPLPGRSVT